MIARICAPLLASLFALAAVGSAPASAAPRTGRPPNFVVVLVDDLGYGDLGCFGHPTIRTPQLDRMAAEGLKLTSFYAAEPVCSPSRAALLTGRLPVRSGMCGDKRRVLFPDSKGGLPADEITLAEALKGRGYATAAVGKWHLGHLPEHMPRKHGFDSFFGIPYSNDMKPEELPLMRNEEVIERGPDQRLFTRRFTEEAVKLIEQHKRRPFFVYLAHPMPHVPLFASRDFQGRSARGLYGDVIEELDWSLGTILETLRKKGLARNTLVVFTSDNGPWLTKHLQGGSAGPLRDGKGSTWEGGMRVPALAWWPGRIGPGRVSHALVSTLDLFATFLGLAGAPLPTDRVLDSHDLGPLLAGNGPSLRQSFFYYRGTQVYAVRKGPYKAHLFTRSGYGAEEPQPREPPVLHHLEHDPGEMLDVARENPEVITDLLREVERHRAGVDFVKSQFD